MMFRRLKQNLMVKAGRASQTAFPVEVEKGLSFCEGSKKDVASLVKTTDAMLSSLKARGLSLHETVGEACSQIATHATKKSARTVLKTVHSTYTELGRVERKSYDEMSSKYVDGFLRDWLKTGLGKQLEDISELKKRRLEKDVCATSANNHPGDGEKAAESTTAAQAYSDQLAVVEENLKVLEAHYTSTASETKILMNALAEHYGAAHSAVSKGASKLA